MSWSVSYVARNKAAAKMEAQKNGHNLPPVVQLLILGAVDGIREDGLIRVHGTGHQAEGSSYEVSTCNLTVEPLRSIVG